MAVKFISHQDPGKLEKLANKALADAKGDLRLHSLSSGNGMFVAVLESARKPQPAAKPKPQPSGKSKR